MQNDETCNHCHAHIPWGWFQSQLQWAKQGKGKALSDSRLAGFQQQCEKHKCTSSQPLFEVKNKFYLRYVVPEKSLPPSLGPIMSPSPFHCGARHLPGGSMVTCDPKKRSLVTLKSPVTCDPKKRSLATLFL